MLQQLVLFQSLATEKLIMLFICPNLIYLGSKHLLNPYKGMQVLQSA